MNGIVCGFSGRRGSGKTSISERVACHLNWPRVSFGAYVRKTAQEQNLDASSPRVLQNLGESLINDGIEKFCRAVIAQSIWEPGQSLVIDGIRHQDVLNKLKEIVVPSLFVLIHIYVDENHRLKRIVHRDGLSQIEARNVDEHSTEKDAKLVLSQLADFKINGDQPMDLVVREIETHLDCILRQCK